jgi:hypothetical protein
MKIEKALRVVAAMQYGDVSNWTPKPRKKPRKRRATGKHVKFGAEQVGTCVQGSALFPGDFAVLGRDGAVALVRIKSAKRFQRSNRVAFYSLRTDDVIWRLDGRQEAAGRLFETGEHSDSNLAKLVAAVDVA